MINKRIFVKKRQGYNQAAIALTHQINQLLQSQLKCVEKYVIYDIFNISDTVFEQAKTTVFSETVTDEVYDSVEVLPQQYFAYEVLPAQFDQRADSAQQCLALIAGDQDVTIRSGTLLTFDQPLSDDELQQLQHYLVNPIEAQVKDLTVLNFVAQSQPRPLKDLTGFTTLDESELLALKGQLSLALTLEDLQFIQEYFHSEHRDPTETELYVLDCYWSDHCRHTTFETVLDDITIQSDLFHQEMQQAFDHYLELRKILGQDKPITLMDMASITAKYFVKILKDSAIEVSDEINACSFFITINQSTQPEKWLVQFKNETHNHPSEIEPFGGASTCIGGAIRDPLSGRSYVYQAMRVSGSGNILQHRKDTLPHKLPQVDISKNSALGYSSYGNQIGLATTYVRELYDESYVAKHMEVGAVVGAVKEGDYQRQALSQGDIVMMIGGRTGRDGIQGASGSSVSHNSQSLVHAASQVQKGNAIEERKLQRLFRHPELTRIIKKCNDFGAGGVCVAVGELHDSIEIYLDKVLVKYQGLNATELAISESQERMAVVIDPQDYQLFIDYCHAENIEYAQVAKITNNRRLVMYFNEQKVVDMGASFLETSGVRQHAKAQLLDNAGANPFSTQEINKAAILRELSSLNVTCQKGLVSQFDASIGNTTVLMPYAGQYQLTPVQASVQSLPKLDGPSDTATILSYGFVPKISHYSPFLSAIYAVLESVAKVYAVGGTHEHLYFSFQEYFERLEKEPDKWGKVTQSLLGALYAQQQLQRPSIGGKDSMSGSYHDLNVVETLISFACTPVKIEDVITPELKTKGNYLYHVPVIRDARGFPDIKATLNHYEQLHQYIKDKKIVSAYVQEHGSVVASLIKMALGNGLGFNIQGEHLLDFDVASLVVESTIELPFTYLGKVCDDVYMINDITLSYDEIYQAYTSTLNDIYPIYVNETKGICENLSSSPQTKQYYPQVVDEVNVVIPVFPGTNCEYDSAYAFEREGAKVTTIVIKNQNEADLQNSIEQFINQLAKSHILMLAGGFSSGDEPDGSAKFIVNFLKNKQVTEAVHRHLAHKKLILGICNGFQALIKSGLLPYGKITDLTPEDLTLFNNDSGRHISTTCMTRVATTCSPWLQDFEVGQQHEVAFSHGEGKLMGMNIDKFKHLIAFQYCDLQGQATMNGQYNPNGSIYAGEGLISPDGLILGKMGHSERYQSHLYKTNTRAEQQNIFKQGVSYFKGE